MARFRKKPVEVEAMRVAEIMQLGIDHGPGGMPEWLVQAIAVDPETDEGFGGFSRLMVSPHGAEVRTKQGQWVLAGPDEWIVCAAPDDLWPVAADVFEATYELLKPDALDRTPGGVAEDLHVESCEGMGT